MAEEQRKDNDIGDALRELMEDGIVQVGARRRPEEPADVLRPLTTAFLTEALGRERMAEHTANVRTLQARLNRKWQERHGTYERSGAHVDE